MGIYTQVQFEYMQGSKKDSIDSVRTGTMISAIIRKFCSPYSWDTADTVKVIMDYDNRGECIHWLCIPTDKKGNQIMVIGALQRSAGEAVEYHS